MSRFKSKVAIVTGAGCIASGWGNGRAMAVRLAEEGAKVFAVDRDADSLAETLDRAGEYRTSIETYVCDVTQSESVLQMVQEVWDTQMNVNLKSVFLTCKHVLPVMIANKKGAIVNVASTSGTRWTGSAQVAYAATKAGVIQLSKVVAVQHAPLGIRVNTVVPGQLHTPMVEARLAKQRTGGDVQALLDSRIKRIPVGFMGDGRDTASAALFLASDEAQFITGTEIVVDGGMTARCD